MSGETSITIIGNLTTDPELRFTPVSREFGKTGGTPVANFTIASTPRTFDTQSKEWKDGDTLFLRSTVWREAAERVAASLTKGSRVVAAGRLKPSVYETRNRRSENRGESIAVRKRRMPIPKKSKTVTRTSPKRTGTRSEPPLNVVGHLEGCALITELVGAATLRELRRLQRKYNGSRKWPGIPGGPDATGSSTP
jgi:single stranded DNA-binding protein